MLIKEFFQKDTSPYRAQLPPEYRIKLQKIKMANGDESHNRILMRLIDEEIERVKHHDNG